MVKEKSFFEIPHEEEGNNQMYAYLLINIIGIVVFIGIAFLFSKNKKNIRWKSIFGYAWSLTCAWHGS